MKRFVHFYLVLMLFGCQPGSGEFLVEVPDQNTSPIEEGDLLTNIQQNIFTPICAQCHIGSQAPLGLRLDSVEEAFLNLVNVPAVGNSAFDRVEPFDPENSFLMLKILGDPIAGQRMPLGMASLSNEEIELIRLWIAQGALAAAASNKVAALSAIYVSDKLDKIILELRFDAVVNSSSVSYDSILIYQIEGSSELLLSTNQYSIAIKGNRTIAIIIDKRNTTNKNFKLVIGDNAPQPITDNYGNWIDVNNSGTEGGNYEFNF